MITVRLPTATINAIATRYGQTPEEYIAQSRGVSLGRTVCAHFVGFEKDGTVSVFTVE